MRDEVTRYRLSILVFDDAARLWRALSDLLEQGLTPAQVCLVGLRETLEELHLPEDHGRGNTDGVADQLAKVLQATEVRLRREGHADLAARCGAQTEALLGRSASTTGPFRWLRNELGKTLTAQAENGAVMLLVSASSAEQQSETARLLLRHGQHALKTHEFTWPHIGP